MSTDMSAEQFVEKLNTYQSAEELKKYHRFFKFDEADKEDTFMGVRMGQVFALAKAFIEMPPDEIEKLLESPIHEIRVGGVSVMDFQARRKQTPQARRQALYDLYLRRHDRINNWDLVDRAAPYVIGSYLFDFAQPRHILYTLAGSKEIWERRTAVVSTLFFIGKGEVADAFTIAERLLNDDQDLIHKATGWVLRVAGDKDRPKLLSFLDEYAATMPRILLRYAIEHLDKEQRDQYMSMKKVR
jgi:hypothetical protein